MKVNPCFKCKSFFFRKENAVSLRGYLIKINKKLRENIFTMNLNRNTHV